MTDKTDGKQNKPYLFQPGQSGNLKGRPKGARSKLGEDFLQDLFTMWKQEGMDCLLRMTICDPTNFCKMVASLQPKELNVKVNPLEEMTDEQLLTRATKLAGHLGFGISPNLGVVEAPARSQPAKKLPPIH